MKKQKYKTFYIEKKVHEYEIEVYSINFFGKSIGFHPYLDFLFEFRFPKGIDEYIALIYLFIVFVGIPYVAHISTFNGGLIVKMFFILVMWLFLIPCLIRVNSKMK